MLKILAFYIKNYKIFFDFCFIMVSKTYLIDNLRVWVKRKNGPDEVVRILLDLGSNDAALCYQLFTAYDEKPDYMGRILFDVKGFWIYDGDVLAVVEQEQVAKFILSYVETI
ncbi:MAG: hypothetical protein JWR38_2850 [Mucilaginibacter sp.]|nr:hypothetical protein [Mucilaginibacter sp.]